MPADLATIGSRTKQELRSRAAHRRLRFGKITEGKLERWYGREVLDSLLLGAQGAHAPIPVMGIPASLYRGEVVMDPSIPRAVRDLVGAERGGFASLSDLIAEATTGGKQQQIVYNKSGTTAVVARSNSLWAVGPLPAAGAFGAAPPGGTAFTRTSTGALGQQNAGGGDTLHLTTMAGLATQACSLMLYDRLFAVQTAANPGTGAISVTGTQSRYTGSAGTPEYPAGVVIVPFVSVTLAGTAHTITYTYTDQDNNAGATSGANTGVSGGVIHQTDLVAGVWCSALAAGDTGVRQLTQIQFSASPATGQVDHTLVKPLAVLPQPVANVGFLLDGINSAFNLVKVQDDACLALMQFFAAVTTAAGFAGQITLVSG